MKYPVVWKDSTEGITKKEINSNERIPRICDAN
jgi:hypothetical protein